MDTLRFTLLTDGPSDRALRGVVRWALEANGVELPIVGEWVDLSILPNPPRALADRIRQVVELAPCDLLFVHRDAERASIPERKAEILRALENAAPVPVPSVCIIPVRMTEAWFLFDEVAIRTGAGNPNGATALTLPPVAAVEGIPDPKALLRNLLDVASGLPARRRRRRRYGLADVARQIDDFSPLRRLEAFRSFENDLRALLDGLQL